MSYHHFFKVTHLCLRTFVILGTVACQAPLSMDFSKQEYWSGFPFPSPGDLPNPETEPGSPHSRQILYNPSHQARGLSPLPKSNQKIFDPVSPKEWKKGKNNSSFFDLGVFPQISGFSPFSGFFLNIYSIHRYTICLYVDLFVWKKTSVWEKMAQTYFSLFLPLNTTENPGYYMQNKHKKNSERWKKESTLAMTQQTRRQ